MRTLFVTGTGTGVGKTVLSAALAERWRLGGRKVAAVKPVETGCAPEPADALALARACGRPELTTAPGLYRARQPLAPWAATLAGEPAPPPVERLAAACRAAAGEADLLLVEGAGGVLVPLDARHDIVELAVALRASALLVARDGLGVLSHTLTAAEALRRREVPLLAVALVRHGAPEEGEDPSLRSNAAILGDRLAPAPVLTVPRRDAPEHGLAVERLAEVLWQRLDA